MTRFLVTVDGKSSFVAMDVAARLCNSWFNKVEIGNLALEDDFSVRNMTDDEYDKIEDTADAYEASK